MTVIEVFANRRSGHHFFMSWLVSNLTGQKDSKIKNLEKITWIGDELCHYNDATYHAFFDIDKVKEEINEIILKSPKFLIINYEEGGLSNRVNMSDSNLSKLETIKVVFLRDFLNTMSSKWAVSNTDMKEFYFGFNNKEQIIENINYWKMMAENFILNKETSLTYEDMLSNEYNRVKFLENFGVKETIKPNELQGTKSSFKSENFNERYKEVNFNGIFIEEIRNDKRLNSLIKKLNYNEITNII